MNLPKAIDDEWIRDKIGDKRISDSIKAWSDGYNQALEHVKQLNKEQDFIEAMKEKK